MSIAAELARLAVVEALRPTGLGAGDLFPTIAGRRVYDSRSISVADLNKQGPTPALSIYTRSDASRRRGEGSSSASRFSTTVIDIAAELAVVDEEAEGGPSTSPLLAGDDPGAQMLLAMLCSQVRYAILNGPSGAIFQRAVKSVDSIHEDRLAMPELGLRWHLAMITLECSIPDDAWGPDGGLPAHAVRTLALFPENSPARTAIAALAPNFAALPTPTPLEGVTFSTGHSPTAPPDGRYP